VEIKDRIRDFVTEEIVFEEGSSPLADETPLLVGIIDSLGLMQLAAFIEQEFGLEIDDSDMTADNFRDINAIVRLVERRITERKTPEGVVP
jgi:acyl carrier protein